MFRTLYEDMKKRVVDGPNCDKDVTMNFVQLKIDSFESERDLIEYVAMLLNAHPNFAKSIIQSEKWDYRTETHSSVESKIDDMLKIF